LGEFSDRPLGFDAVEASVGGLVFDLTQTLVVSVLPFVIVI